MLCLHFRDRICWSGGLFSIFGVHNHSYTFILDSLTLVAFRHVPIGLLYNALVSNLFPTSCQLLSAGRLCLAVRILLPGVVGTATKPFQSCYSELHRYSAPCNLTITITGTGCNHLIKHACVIKNYRQHAIVQYDL